MVEIGSLYKHYKGGIYKVINIATHTETEEIMVVYEDSSKKVYARPLTMFENYVDENTKRFVKLERKTFLELLRTETKLYPNHGAWAGAILGSFLGPTGTIICSVFGSMLYHNYAEK